MRAITFKLAVPVIAVAALVSACHPGPNPIHYGDTVSSSLASTGEIDDWRLQGASGDRLFVRLRRTSGPWEPIIEVRRNDTSLVCSNSGGGIVDIECVLPVTETYLVRVRDGGNNEAGNYTLHTQRLNPPVPLPPLLSYDGDSPTSAGIGTHGEIDNFRFNGAAGDRLFTRIARTSGGFQPVIEVRRQTGVLFCSNTGPGPIADVECVLPATETYLIRVSDSGSDNLGNYTIAIQRLNNPVPVIGIGNGYGQTVSGSITSYGEIDYIRFEGSTGDRLFARANVDNFTEEVEVRRQDGTLLLGCSTAEADTAVDVECVLPATELYLVGISAALDPGGGPWLLYIQRLNPPVPLPEFIAPGDPSGGTAQSGGWPWIDNYRVAGAENDHLRVQVTRQSGGYEPFVDVRRQNGEEFGCSATGFLQATTDCLLPATETYLVRVQPGPDSQLGSYTVAVL